jgi:hypothetical protein
VREQTHTGRGMLALAIASIITACMSSQTPDGGLPRRPALGVALGPAAFPRGAALAETKMGAPLSFVAAPLALFVARIVRWRGLSTAVGVDGAAQGIHVP